MKRNEKIKAQLEAARKQALYEKESLDLSPSGKGALKCSYATGTGYMRKPETVPFSGLERAANYRTRGSSSRMDMETAEALFMRGQSLNGGRRAGTRQKSK